MSVVNIRVHMEDFPYYFIIRLGNHWFDYYSYYCEGKYPITIHTRGKETHVGIDYENLFFGTMHMSGLSWSMILKDKNSSIMTSFFKSRDSISIYNNHTKVDIEYYNPKKKKSKTKNNENNDTKLDKSECDIILSKIISKYNNLYKQITNKEVFRQQMLEEIEFLISPSNTDKYLEYDSDYLSFIENFIESEKCCLYIQNHISVESLRENYPELKTLTKDLLDYYLNDNYFLNDLHPSIYFESNKEILLKEIISGIIKLLNEERIADNIEIMRKKYSIKTIKKVFNNRIKKAEDRDFLLKILEEQAPNYYKYDENIFLEKINNLIDDHLSFEKYYDRFISTYNYSSIHLELTKEKEKRFKLYEQGELTLNQDELDEYDLLYSKSIDYINTLLYDEDTNNIRTFYKKIPFFSKYFSLLMDWLFQHNVLHEVNDTIYCDNISALKDLPRELQIFASYYGKHRTK